MAVLREYIVDKDIPISIVDLYDKVAQQYLSEWGICSDIENPSTDLRAIMCDLSTKEVKCVKFNEFLVYIPDEDISRILSNGQFTKKEVLLHPKLKRLVLKRRSADIKRNEIPDIYDILTRTTISNMTEVNLLLMELKAIDGMIEMYKDIYINQEEQSPRSLSFYQNFQ